ncbi:MAG: ribonuclease H-like YkuK family protein [Bacteroidota bacterium]|nr:ribonuclease H-like YkuK family protein [Bacteroidota bacterium]
MKFKRLTNDESFDLIPYLKSFLSQKKAYEVQIHVGCDSQVKLGRTIYVSTIVLHVGLTGCHILYKKEIVPKKLDLWSKLWGEVERSVQLTRFLIEHQIKIESINLDLNDKPIHASNRLVSSALGFAMSTGVNVRIKPNVLPAISAADNLSK